MAFTSKRGRPKKDISENGVTDRGTPELCRKRQCSETTEVVDLLLQRGVINADQHWCALHYRWLYTLRYGSPMIQSMDPAYVRGILHKAGHEEWQQERELEWNEIQKELIICGYRRYVMEACIYNILYKNNEKELVNGLLLLVKRWCKRGTYE